MPPVEPRTSRSPDRGGAYDGTSFTDPSWGSTQVWLALVPTPPPGVKLLARLHDANGLVDERYDTVVCD